MEYRKSDSCNMVAADCAQLSRLLQKRPVVCIVAAVAKSVDGNPALAALLLKVSAIAGSVGSVAGTTAQITAKKPPRGQLSMKLSAELTFGLPLPDLVDQAATDAIHQPDEQVTAQSTE